MIFMSLLRWEKSELEMHAEIEECVVLERTLRWRFIFDSFDSFDKMGYIGQVADRPMIPFRAPAIFQTKKLQPKTSVHPSKLDASIEKRQQREQHNTVFWFLSCLCSVPTDSATLLKTARLRLGTFFLTMRTFQMDMCT
jgi:hypothetical protein